MEHIFDKPKYNINFLVKGEIPKQFKPISEKIITNGLYKGFNIGYVIDFHPFYLIHNRNIFEFDDDFIEYLREVQRMRINFYCPFQKSWQEHYKNYNIFPHNSGDNYSRYEH